jgi:B12-binding domain/radical SAM domain protein
VHCLGIHSLVFRAHSSSRYSVATLLGAIETDPRLVELEVSAPIEPTNRMIRSVLERGPLVLAHSVISTQVKRVLQEVRRTRERFGTQIIHIAGGPHASARPGDLLEAGFDYVVIGEGERAFPDLLWHLFHDKDSTGIPGVVSECMSHYPSPRTLPKICLDEYPPFALDMNVVGPIEVTRGCPFACKFCCTPFLTGGGVRHRSIDTIVMWLRKAVERRGFERTWFLSPNALCYGGAGRTVVPEKLEALLKQTTAIEGLKELFFGSFPSEVRPEFVSKRVLETLRQYVANKTLQIGLQSGSDHVLKSINRHHTLSEGMHAVTTSLDCGFIPHVDMIFGLPGESKTDLDASLNLCQSLVDMGARVHGHVFMPLPGSAFETAPPGKLDKDTRRFLAELSKKKVLTGSWSQQEKLGADLAARSKLYAKSKS